MHTCILRNEDVVTLAIVYWSYFYAYRGHTARPEPEPLVSDTGAATCRDAMGRVSAAE